MIRVDTFMFEPGRVVATPGAVEALGRTARPSFSRNGMSAVSVGTVGSLPRPALHAACRTGAAMIFPADDTVAARRRAGRRGTESRPRSRGPLRSAAFGTDGYNFFCSPPRALQGTL